MSRLLALAAVLLLALPLTGCPDRSTRQDALDRALYAYAGMIRWGEFEAAHEYLDPELRAAAPLTELDLERYRQIQITSYRLKSAGPTPDGGYARTAEVGVVNRHTQTERTVQALETWRWDEDARRWWLTSGLPPVTAQR